MAFYDIVKSGDQTGEIIHSVASEAAVDSVSNRL